MKRVLNTNVMIYLLSGHLVSPPGQTDIVVSVITELELLSYASFGEGEEQMIRDALRTITVIDLNEDVKEATLKLRRNNRLKLPDAIIAATAVVLEAELWSYDRKLLAIRATRTFQPPIK